MKDFFSRQLIDHPWRFVFFLYFFVAIMIATVRVATAHGDLNWMKKYSSPTPSPYSGANCCGEADCFELVKDVDFSAVGDYWIFRPTHAILAIQNQFPGLVLVGATWPRDYGVTYRSENDHHHLCVGRKGIRCFFLDQGGI